MRQLGTLTRWIRGLVSPPQAMAVSRTLKLRSSSTGLADMQTMPWPPGFSMSQPCTVTSAFRRITTASVPRIVPPRIVRGVLMSRKGCSETPSIRMVSPAWAAASASLRFAC